MLKEMGDQLGITVTTRDAWVKFEGNEDSVRAGQAVFADLEKARRRGGAITPHSFRYAMKAASAGNELDGSHENSPEKTKYQYGNGKSF